MFYCVNIFLYCVFCVLIRIVFCVPVVNILIIFIENFTSAVQHNSEQFPRPFHQMIGRQQSSMYNYYNRDKKIMAYHHKILQTAEFS